MRAKNKALYREGKSDLTQLAGKSLYLSPRRLEVVALGYSYKVLGYSIVMAAEALGKSVIQLRTWLRKGYIPEPCLHVDNHDYYVYDSKEMQIIRKHLYRYSKTGVSYITKNSLDFVDALSEEINHHRSVTYGY